MALAHKQLSLIHVAKAQLCMEEDDYRAILRRFGGVESSANLDPSGFARVMDAFTRLGFRSDFSKRNFGERAAMASPRQVALIRDLWTEYTGGEGTDATLGKWLERTFKVSSLRFLTAECAPKAITALKAMKAKKKETVQR
ncbi:regulatory protein GemA [Magnetospirillum sp. 15-1]|uniref:regulatory protein GemA n=1 Tax=Magnetospirillum sp. 15-1 TaxID=1979370 RepID=UPI000BBCB78F|nr:regulatory protein GemA [Magnetospirillum sp. 15-1]